MKAKWQKTGLKAPLCITWEITSQCNLQCNHCLSPSVSSLAGDLNLAEAKELVDQLLVMGVFYINIGGGEPFCREDIFTILDYLREKHIPVQLSTNGTLIDEQKVNFLRKIEDLRIQVSLDGATREVNDLIRGEGSFKGAINAIKLLADAGINLSINFVITRQNFDDLDSCYRLVKSYGAKFRVSRLRPSGSARSIYENTYLDEARNKLLYCWLLEHPDVATGDSFFFLSGLGKPLSGMNSCGAATMTCSVAPNGNVYPCAFLMDGESAGNIRQEKLSIIWKNSSLFQLFRQKSVKECSQCGQVAFCGGGCPVVSNYYSGYLFGKDPECLIL